MSETTIDFADALDGWIGGATVATRSVVLYAKAGLFGLYQEKSRELELAKAEDDDQDSLASSPRVRELEKELEAIYDEWIESKSIWRVRAVGDADWELARDGSEDLGWEPLVAPETLDEPAKPVEPRLFPNASDTAKRSHTVKLKEYASKLEAYEVELAEYQAKLPAALKAVESYMDELNLRLLSCVVTEIKLGDAVGYGISVEQLRAYRKKVGPSQFTQLLAESKKATEEEPAIPAPFSRASSETDPT